MGLIALWVLLIGLLESRVSSGRPEAEPLRPFRLRERKKLSGRRSVGGRRGGVAREGERGDEEFEASAVFNREAETEAEAGADEGTSLGLA